MDNYVRRVIFRCIIQEAIVMVGIGNYIHHIYQDITSAQPLTVNAIGSEI